VRLRRGRTRIANYALNVEPAAAFREPSMTPHGNWLSRFTFAGKREEFSIDVDLITDGGDQSVRFLRRAPCGELAVRIPSELQENVAAHVKRA
jgi:hypothetical protein